MRRFTVRSFDGVGPLKLGMRRDEVRRELNGKVEEFRKGPNSPTLSDFFAETMMVAYYDLEDRLEAVEFGDELVADWNGILLVGRPAKAIFDDVKQYSSKVEIDDDGVIFHDLGFGLYSPGWLEGDSEMNEGVIVFKRSYYETHRENSKKIGEDGPC
jgi:hypothetical protein